MNVQHPPVGGQPTGRHQDEVRERIARLHGSRHEARRRAVLDSIRSRRAAGANPRHTLIARLLGR